MSFDAPDEESLTFKLRLRNLDGLSREERRMQYAERVGVPAERVCEKHGTDHQPDCPECFPPSPSVSVFDAPHLPYLTAWGDSRLNEPSQVRVELEAEPPRKKHRDDVCSIGVDDCDWTMDTDAIMRGEGSLRKFCRLTKQVLAHYFDDAEFSKPIGFEKPKRRHRTTEENAKVEPTPIFAFSESERSFYKEAASRNLNRAELRVKHGEWPMAKIVELEARMLRHAVKVNLIHLLPGKQEIRLRAELLASLFAEPGKQGFTETKDVKNTAGYLEDRTQDQFVDRWSNADEAEKAAMEAWLDEW